MNTKKLILTSTVGMTREQWLEWRNPLFHIKNFIFELWKSSLPTKDKRETKELFWDQRAARTLYLFLEEVFKDKSWKEFKFPCIGASEISSIVGLNPYKSIIELFYEKVGLKEPWVEENEAMFWGKEGEANIADKWQYWDGDKTTYIPNFRAGNVIRRCRRSNSYIQNIDFPFLFCSLDRIINKGIQKKEGVLECKEISGFASKMWEEGIPPMYVAQLQDQLLITELEDGELAILKDGRYFEVLPFDRSEPITAQLLADSGRFFELVKAGCAEFLLSQYAPDESTKLMHLARVDDLSPDPDGSLSYQSYLKENYDDKGLELTGNLEHLTWAQDYTWFNQAMKEMEARQNLRKNKLMAFMKDAAIIKFGEEGYVSWKQGKTSRTFLVKVKLPTGYEPQPEEESVKIEA